MYPGIEIWKQCLRTSTVLCSHKHDEDESKFLCFRDTASLQSTETHLTFLFRAAEYVVPFSPLIRVGKVGKPPLL